MRSLSAPRQWQVLEVSCGFTDSTMTKALDLGLSVSITAGLIHPCRADRDVHKRFAGELMLLFLQSGKALSGNLGAELLKVRS